MCLSIDTWLFPIGPKGKIIPPPYPQENHERKAALPILGMRKIPKPMREERKQSFLCENGKMEEWVVWSFPTHVKVNEFAGGVCVWERTDSPANTDVAHSDIFPGK